MKFIEEMAERMDEELDSAEEYAEGAIKYKDAHPMLAKHLHDMAQDELRHAQYFADAACEYVKQHPEHNELRTIWYFLKNRSEKQIRRIGEMLERFRG